MPNRKRKALRWADASRAAALTLLLGSATSVAAEDRPREPHASMTVGEQPADSLRIGVAPKQTFVVGENRSNCRDLPQLLHTYMQKNFIVVGVEGSSVRVSDLICVARIAKQRGGLTYVPHEDGTLRTATVDEN